MVEEIRVEMAMVVIVEVVMVVIVEVVMMVVIVEVEVEVEVAVESVTHSKKDLAIVDHHVNFLMINYATIFKE